MHAKLSEVLNHQYKNYIMPFFWQHGADQTVLKEYMQKIHDCGIGAVCLEARPHPDFVGPKWWEDVDTIMQEAKRLGMQVWILDDSHFPTGYANGAVADAPDELKRWYLLEKKMEVDGPLDGWHIEVSANLGYRSMMGMRSEYKREELVGVVLGRQSEVGGEVAYEDLQDVTDLVKDGYLSMAIPDGHYTVFTYTMMLGAASKASDHVSFLNRDSVKILIDTVYEPHYKRYHEEFGKTFAGFFSDEPGFYNLQGNPFAMLEIGDLMPLPWTNEVGEELIRKTGGLTDLPGLFHPLGGKEHLIRYTYMDIITRCYEENFSRQLGDWCEEHGVEYIGHVLEDAGLHSKLGPGTGHYFRAMAGQHMGGIDIVLNGLLPEHDYGDGAFYHYGIQQLAVSAAEQNARMHGRSMCEIFGAFGWSEGLTMMKWMADHMMVGGINHFVPHAFSEKAFPDPDCPPHFYAHGMNPQYRYMHVLFHYMNRVCHLLSGGHAVADVAILFPAEGEWSGAYRDYTYIGKLCLTNQVPYQLLPCDLLEKAVVQDKKICVGQAQYRLLLVDSIERLPEHILAGLQKLQEDGADVRFVGRIPSDLDGNQGPSCIPCIEDNELLPVLTAGRLVQTDAFQKWLRIYPYRHDGLDVYFIVNSSPLRTIDSVLACKEKKQMVWYHPEDNTLEEVEWTEDGGIRLHLDKEESVILLNGEEIPEGQYRKNYSGTWVTYEGEYRVYTADYSNQAAYEMLEQSTKLKDISKLKKDFSGMIRYELEATGKIHQLDLGEVYEAAEVFVNDRSAGIRISHPYVFDVDQLCGDETNLIRIEIATSLGKAMRDDLSLQRPFSPDGVLGPVRLLKN